MDPPALALDEGLHADASGPHPAAAAFHAQRRPARLSRLRLLHRRHGARRAAQSGFLGVLCDLACRGAANFDPLFPQFLLFLCLFNLLAGNGAFTYLIMLAPIRRGWLNLIPFSFTLFGYWVLISVAAYRGFGSSSAILLLGKNPARRIAARRRAIVRTRR
jgi:hypothetical protein